MKNKINFYFNNFVNPLLYYIDKDGNSVFRNFCLFKNNGNIYKKTIPVKEAGHILEKRIEFGKKLRLYNISFTVILYLIFLHFMFSFSGLFLLETIWILLFFAGRFYAAETYKKLLIRNYGEYQITDFTPPLKPEKNAEYKKHFASKIVLFFILMTIFVSFAFCLLGLIKYNVNKEKPNYNTAEILSNLYLKIYPPIPLIYEIRACEDYISGDFGSATNNYLKVFKMNTITFKRKDYTKFANLLYLVKKSNGSQNAIDVFNEYATKYKTTISQQSKLLWIKSMFSIANEITDFVEADYNDLLASIDKNDKANQFYILSDKAYMLYLMKDYNKAIEIYNYIIPYAKDNKDKYSKDIPRLLAERGFAKKQLHDKTGANADFVESKINLYEIQKYEPQIIEPEFILEKF